MHKLLNYNLLQIVSLFLFFMQSELVELTTFKCETNLTSNVIGHSPSNPGRHFATIPNLEPTLQTTHEGQATEACLRLDSTPLHALLSIPLPLLLQKLPLLLGAQSSELSVALLSLELVSREFALFCLLLIVCPADLGNLFLARLADAAQGFWAEVRSGNELVGEAEEVGKDGKRSVVVVGQLEREVDTLARLCLIEAGRC